MWMLSWCTCNYTSVRLPGVFKAGTVQQVVSLQEAVERAEDGGMEDDVQRDRLSSGQEGVDKTPTEQTHEVKSIL